MSGAERHCACPRVGRCCREFLYVKSRKHRKVIAAELINTMTRLNVTQPIATAILRSMEKANDLEVTRNGPGFIMKNKLTLPDGTELTEKYRVAGARCSCCKLEQTGLPCCHIIRGLTEKGQSLSSQYINQRWTLNESSDIVEVVPDFLDTENMSFEPVTSSNAHTELSPQGRYTLLLAQSRSVIAVASRTHEAFIRLTERLTEIEAELHNETNPDPTKVIEQHASRPGRKPKRRTPSRA